MVSASVGWAVESATDRILRTANGGLSWGDVSPPGLDREFHSTPAFVSTTEAWALGPAPIRVDPSSGAEVQEPAPVLHTVDGGTSWTTVGGDPITGTLSFLDSRYGWTLDAGPCATQCQGQGATIARTVDGGAHWQVVARTPERLGGPQGQLPLDCGKRLLEFLTPVTGVLGEGCTAPSVQVLVTHDGGVTWANVALAQASQSASQATDPLRVSSASAYVLGSDFPSALLFVTRDGAATWRRVALPEATAGGSSIGVPVSFVDARDGYFRGSRLYRTANGGISWAAVASDLPAVDALQFVTTTVGFAINGDSQDLLHLFRTTDGGPHWELLQPRRAG